jgi:hypothetical protein
VRLSDEKYKFLVQRKKDVLGAYSLHRANRVDVSDRCEKFYTEFLDLEKPKIFLTAGPTEACKKLEYLKKSEDAKQFGPHVKRLIAERVFATAKSSKEYVSQQLGEELFLETKRMVFGDFNRSVTHNIGSPVFGVLNGQSRELCSKEYADYPSYADRDWLSFYSIISEVFELNNPVDQRFREFVESDLFCGFFFENVAIIVPMPQYIKRDEQGRLHEEEGAALEWADGTKVCFWNGIQIPEKLIFQPDAVTADDILGETNAEVRRCYQEALGSHRFGSLLGLISLDKKLDRFGNELILYRTKDKDHLAGDHIYFAKVVCPSTGRIYFLCVPPGIESVEHAVSWTFGKTPGEYQPVVET